MPRPEDQSRELTRGASKRGRGRLAATVLLFALAATACGGRTDLRRGELLPPECVDGDYPVQGGHAELMLVVDRSRSMGFSLDGRDLRGSGATNEASRWELLRDALSQAWVGADVAVEVGAKFYPDEGVSSSDAEAACRLSRGVDLRPAPGNLERLLALFAAMEPAGGTPTAASVHEAVAFLSPRKQPRIRQSIVLFTDGGPNCNPDLVLEGCVCASTPPCTHSANCVDEMGAVAAMEEAFTANGIPVFVIGIVDPTRPDLADVLDHMALAGGRPRLNATRAFYDIREPTDLVRALDAVMSEVTRCEFIVPSIPNETGSMDVTLNGQPAPHDPSRTNGWEWVDRERGEFAFYGSYCDGAIPASAVTIAAVHCGPPPRDE